MSNIEELALLAAEAGYALAFDVPYEVVMEARRGLELRRRFGRGGLTPAQARAVGVHSGLSRARQLAAGKPLSLHDVKRMSAYFSRHAKDKLAPRFHDAQRPSNGAIAWALWGGDPALDFVNGILGKPV